MKRVIFQNRGLWKYEELKYAASGRAKTAAVKVYTGQELFARLFSSKCQKNKSTQTVPHGFLKCNLVHSPSTIARIYA